MNVQMFDSITVDYPLPSKDAEEKMHSPPDWKEMEYITDSLDCDMQNYTIEDDGQLYKEKIERELVRQEDGSLEVLERDCGIEKMEYTGEVRFHAVHFEDEEDFFVQFLALFWKGELKEITLEKIEVHDSQIRKEHNKKLHDAVEENFKEPNFYSKAIKYVTHPVRWVLGLLIKICWKIERLGS